MKELSIKEKAKAYDEALKVIKECSPDENGFITIYPQEIFPELKESDDERIRKWLISVVDRLLGTIDCPFGTDKVLAWLEKQGEHANFRNKIQIGDKVTRNEDGVLVNLSQLNRVAKKDEKQVEQKPADKVEPKFHEGEWIVDKQGLIHQIERVVENVTTHTFGYDIVGGGYFNDNNEGVHLWTIKDAKDGDVLVNWNNYIYLFKGIEEEVVKFYCYYSTNHEEFNIPFNNNSHLGLTEPQFKHHLATKEQCDLLFQKMKEAGYEWDAELKQLKKIEQKPVKVPKFKVGDTMRTLQEAKDGWTDGMPVVVSIDKEYYHCNNELIAIKDQDDYEYPPMNRIQPQPQWKPSDEQMEALDDAIAICSERDYETECRLDNLRQELKKLREE